MILENKVRFILGVNSGLIKVTGVKRNILIDRLQELKFKTITEINEILPDRQSKTVVDNNDPLNETNQSIQLEEQKIDEGGQQKISAKEYDYLTSMPIFSLTEEKVVEL